jgi:hypothetical protein
MWYPEIMYEEEVGGSSSKIPFILVPKGQAMPTLLYIFESRDTGETEPGNDGADMPVFEMDLHQYADMSVLKENLTPDLYDQVRLSLGLETMAAAAKKGSKITQSVRKNLE